MKCRGCPYFKENRPAGHFCSCNGEWVFLCHGDKEPEPVPSCPWYGDEEDEE